MNINQLRQFAVVAQLENMSRAADDLHISQSSLSKAIYRLEEELGIRLFDRNGKKIVLNEAGLRFLECCGRMLMELDNAVDSMRLISTGMLPCVHIGTVGMERQIVDCALAFQKENPSVEFDINTALEGVSKIDINDYDALVYPKGPRYDKFNGYVLGEETYYLAVPKSHPLAHSAVVLPKNWAGENFVILRHRPYCLEFPYRISTALSIPFGSQNFVDSFEMHRQMISAGHAVGFVQKSWENEYRKEPNIRLIPILDERFSRTIMICFKREKHLTALGRSFRDFCIEYYHLQKPVPPRR